MRRIKWGVRFRRAVLSAEPDAVEALVGLTCLLLAFWMTGILPEPNPPSPPTIATGMVERAPWPVWAGVFGLLGLLQLASLWDGDIVLRRIVNLVQSTTWAGLAALFIVINDRAIASMFAVMTSCATTWIFLRLRLAYHQSRPIWRLDAAGPEDTISTPPDPAGEEPNHGVHHD